MITVARRCTACSAHTSCIVQLCALLCRTYETIHQEGVLLESALVPLSALEERVLVVGGLSWGRSIVSTTTTPLAPLGHCMTQCHASTWTASPTQARHQQLQSSPARQREGYRTFTTPRTKVQSRGGTPRSWPRISSSSYCTWYYGAVLYLVPTTAFVQPQDMHRPVR